jgi:hypothetical protein
MLRRDPKEPIIETLEPDQAWEYIKNDDLCNPHQMVRDARKMRMREKFFKRFFGESQVNLINTIRQAEETQKIIRDIVLK